MEGEEEFVEGEEKFSEVRLHFLPPPYEILNSMCGGQFFVVGGEIYGWEEVQTNFFLSLHMKFDGWVVPLQVPKHVFFYGMSASYTRV